MIKPGDFVCYRQGWVQHDDPPFFFVIVRGLARDMLRSPNVSTYDIWLKLVDPYGRIYLQPEAYMKKFVIPGLGASRNH